MGHRVKLLIYFVLGLLVFNGLTQLHAQVRKGDKKHKHKHKTAQSSYKKKPIDSFQARRNFVRDSLADARKYRDSKHYRDSVSRSLASKAEDLRLGRQAKADSSKQVRQYGIDSATAARKYKTDSIRAYQKHRTDSLAVIRKYRTSKRYTDSVTLAHRVHADSIKRAQTHFRDSIATLRKHTLDSAKTARKHVMDSVKLVRTHYMDSIKVVRKAKTDSLAKVKAAKEKEAKALAKKREEQQKLKLELKFKKKREAWSNKSMLKKPWSPVRRIFQNAFTHYNYYYNANKKMDEALLNMQRSRKENYDSLICLYPFDPNKDSVKMKGDMDTIIRKASIGLQIHDPRVKWSNDLFLLLGEANYYKGNYQNASIAFRYIIAKDEEEKKKQALENAHYGEKSKEEPSIVEDEKGSVLDFLKHKSVHNESILWLARTYTSWHMIENAESVISLLESDSHLPDDLVGRVAAEKAFAYLDEKNDGAAITQLQIVKEDPYSPDWLRMRAAFLTGQLQQERGEYHQAAESFENVLAFYPKIDMDFYTRKRIAYNSLLAGDDAASAMRPLKKVLNDGKYVTFYDQVYFVLGKLAIQAGKTDEAIDYLNKSIATPKATKKQKAMSFAALGDAYYADTKYKLAKLSYDSAAKYNTPASKDTTGLSNISRAKTLNDIVAPATVIHDEDSLLALSLLSKKDQLAAVRRYLKYLEQNRDDSVTAAENAILNSFSTPESGAESPSDYGSWYFSNPSLVQQGSSDFKRKWGNRTLTDNWRRSAGNAFNNSSNDEVQETDASDEKGANGLPSEKSLLAKIPNTPDQKIRAEQAEQKAYIQLAKAYYNLFDDYGNAIATLDKLDEKFPDHDQKLDDLYLRYQIAIKQGKLEIAQKYANTIVKDFPDSDYAKLLKPREGSKSESQLTKVTVEKYYDSTYNLLLTRQYSDALVHIDVAKKQFDNPVFHKRFLVAEAMALAGMGDFDKADTAIQAFLHTYPGHDTLSDWARSIKEYIGDMRKTGMPSWYKPSPPGSKEKAAGDSTKATSDSAHIAAAGPAAPKPDPIPETPAMYQNHPADQHYCIVILPGIDSRMPELRKKIQSFDSARFADGHLDIILDYFDMDKTVMVVKKFANAGTAQTYMSTLQSSDCFSAFAGTEFKPMIISAANYRKLFADKNIAAYISFYDAVYLK